MKNKISIYLFLFVTLTFSCTKDDDVEAGGPFDGSEKSLQEFFNPEIVEALKDLGFKIHKGNNPPNIEGSYLSTPVELKATTVEKDYSIGTKFRDYVSTFSNQNNEKSTVDFDGAHPGNIQVDNGDGVFIAGEGSNFSVYLKIKTIAFSLYEAEFAYAISGTISDDGIIDFQFVNLMLDDFGDESGLFIENNTGRLLEDSDGLSNRIDSTTTEKSIKADINQAIVSSILEKSL